MYSRIEKKSFFLASQILGSLVRLIKPISLSFIRRCGNVVYSVEKSYVDHLEALKFLDLNLVRTSLEFLIDQNS